MCPVVCALLIQIQMMTQMKRVHSCTPVWMSDLVRMEKYTSGVEFKVRCLDFVNESMTIEPAGGTGA